MRIGLYTLLIETETFEAIDNEAKICFFFNLPSVDIPVIGNVVDVVLEIERIAESVLVLITVDQQQQRLAFVKLELFVER